VELVGIGDQSGQTIHHGVDEAAVPDMRDLLDICELIVEGLRRNRVNRGPLRSMRASMLEDHLHCPFPYFQRKLRRPMAPSSQALEPPQNPGRFSDRWAGLSLLFQLSSEWNYLMASKMRGQVIKVIAGVALDAPKRRLTVLVSVYQPLVVKRRSPLIIASSLAGIGLETHFQS